MRQSVESEYNMQGLGQLLQLYGGAAAETEYEYKHLSEQFKDISERRKEENNRERREKMKRQLHKLKSEMGAAQEKIAGYSRSAMQMLNEADQKLDKLAIEGVSKFKEADRKFDEYVKNSVDSLVVEWDLLHVTLDARVLQKVLVCLEVLHGARVLL